MMAMPLAAGRPKAQHTHVRGRRSASGSRRTHPGKRELPRPRCPRTTATVRVDWGGEAGYPHHRAKAWNL